MQRMKRVLADLRQGRYLESYSAFLLALVVVGFEIVAGLGGDDPQSALVSGMTILLLAVLTLNTVEIRRGQSLAPSGAKLSRFFPSRDNLPTLHRQLSDCKKRANIFGVQLAVVVHNLLPLIEERAAAGVKIDLAMLSPVDRAGVRIPWTAQLGQVHDFPNLDELLNGNARRLQTWHAHLDPEVKKNVSVRAFTEIPTASVAFYDAQSYDGYIHVEPVMYRLNPQQRPSFWVRRADDVALFEILLKKYQALWDSSIPIDELAITATAAS